MHLQAIQSIDHVAAGSLQHTGPSDIILFIKAGLQFHKNVYLLSVLRGLHQRLHYLAVLCQTIEGHLNGNHIRVICRLAQHIQEGTYTLIRIGKKLILFNDLRKQRFRLIQHRGPLGYPPFKEEFRLMTQDILNIKNKGEIQGRFALKDHILVDLQIVFHLGQDLLVQVSGVFHPDGRQLPSLLDHLRHMIPVVQFLIIYLICIDIRISRNTDQRLTDDIISLEYTGKEMQDQFFRKHKVSLGPGDLDQSPEHAVITRYDTDPGLGSLGLAALGCKNRHRTDLVILDKRKRLLLADRDGGKKGHDLLLEVGLQIGTLFFIQLLEIDEMDILRLHTVHQIRVGSIFSLDQFLYPFPNGLQLFLSCHFRFIFLGVVLQEHLVMKGSDAHHEEFIQICLEDGNKTEPLTERRSFILRFLKYTFIKSQPGQFPVLVELFRHNAFSSFKSDLFYPHSTHFYHYNTF